LLVGSILTVSPGVVLKTAIIYTFVGVFHYFARDRFLTLSFGDARGARRSLMWDLLFYATFGVVVTSSVRVCGVLLVFIFLVVPSVFAALVTESIGRRLALGWVFGLVGSAVGLVLSFALDTPPGATIVCTFGAMLLILLLPFRLLHRPGAP